MLNLKHLFISVVTVAGLMLSQVSVAEPLALTSSEMWLTSSSVSLPTHFSEQLDAQAKEGGQGKGKKLAMEACEGKADGTSCSFEGKRGRTVNGTCETHNDTSICVSERHKQRRAACEGKQAGDACSVNDKTGTCQERGDVLVCKKNR